MNYLTDVALTLLNPVTLAVVFALGYSLFTKTTQFTIFLRSSCAAALIGIVLTAAISPTNTPKNTVVEKEVVVRDSEIVRKQGVEASSKTIQDLSKPIEQDFKVSEPEFLNNEKE